MDWLLWHKWTWTCFYQTRGGIWFMSQHVGGPCGSATRCKDTSFCYGFVNIEIPTLESIILRSWQKKLLNIYIIHSPFKNTSLTFTLRHWDNFPRLLLNAHHVTVTPQVQALLVKHLTCQSSSPSDLFHYSHLHSVLGEKNKCGLEKLEQ